MQVPHELDAGVSTKVIQSKLFCKKINTHWLICWIILFKFGRLYLRLFFLPSGITVSIDVSHDIERL